LEQRAHPLRCPGTYGFRVDRQWSRAKGARAHTGHQRKVDVHLLGFYTCDKSRPSTERFFCFRRLDPHICPIQSKLLGRPHGVALEPRGRVRVRDSQQELRVTRRRISHRRWTEMGAEYLDRIETSAQYSSGGADRRNRTTIPLGAFVSRTSWRERICVSVGSCRHFIGVRR
jgi:hypothetical protein